MGQVTTFEICLKESGVWRQLNVDQLS